MLELPIPYPIRKRCSSIGTNIASTHFSVKDQQYRPLISLSDDHAVNVEAQNSRQMVPRCK